MIFSAPLVLPILLTPGLDNFGAEVTHDLGVPDWALSTLDFDQIEAGDVDGDAGLDLILLGPNAGQSSTVVSLQNVRDWIRPQVLATDASAMSLLPSGSAAGAGVLVATSTGLRLFSPGDDGLDGTDVPSTSAYVGCSELSMAQVNGSLFLTALAANGDLLTAEWNAGQLQAHATLSGTGATGIGTLEWQVDQAAVAVTSPSAVTVYDLVTGLPASSYPFAGTSPVLRVSLEPGQDRVLLGYCSGTWTVVEVFEPVAGRTPTLLSPVGRNVSDLDLGDVDGDGLLDLCVSLVETAESWILYADQEGGPAPFNFVLGDPDGHPLVCFHDQITTGNRFALGDGDGDGDVDLLKTDRIGGTPLVVQRANKRVNINDLRPVFTQIGLAESYDEATGAVHFGWRDALRAPARTEGGLLVTSTHIQLDIFLQDEGDSSFDPSPWRTLTVEVSPQGGPFGFTISENVGSDNEGLIYHFRMQHMSGSERVGPALHFTHSFSQTVTALITSTMNWSRIIRDAAEDAGVGPAGEHNERGSTTPVTPPGT